MWQRFPPRMRRALVAALDDAGRQGRDTARVEDLFVAVAADRESAGMYVLEQCGVNASRIVERDTNGNGHAGPPAPRAKILDENSLRVLRLADGEATRLNHDHVGTEHVIAAMAMAADLEIGRKLNDAGLTPKSAEEAIERWSAEGMPRRRDGMGWMPVRPKWLSRILRPVRKILRFGPLLWSLYARKSLGHPGFVKNPYPLYRWLREREPVRRDPLAPVWILTRYDDVMEMLKNPKYLKDPFGPQRLPKLVREQLEVGLEDRRVEAEVVSMLFLDPPRHTQVRSVFARAFTPASLGQLRTRIEKITGQCLDKVAQIGRMDLIADLAYPLPVIVIAEMLGFPAEDYPRIKVWSDVLAASLSLNATGEQQAAASIVWGEMHEYFDHVVLKMNRGKEGPLLARILESEDEPGGLCREEIFTNSVLLLSAGHETTTNLIGNGMLALLRNRDQWELLCREPGLIESAVEEILRYDSPVQWTSRLPAEPTEIGGKTVPAGEIILGAVGAANRDPEKFPDPDRLDIRRKENRHLAFGIGIHYCLGAALARMEAQIAIGELARRFPNMRMSSKRLQWIKGLTFRGVRELRVILK